MFGQWTTPAAETREARERYDFTVRRTPALYQHSDGTFISTKRVALVREVLPGVDSYRGSLGVVGYGYTPVLHKDVIDAFDKRFREQNAYFERRVAIGGAGQKMMVEYRFPETQVEVRPGDKVALTLLGGNSFDTSTAIWLQVGAFRLICTNGAIIGKVLAFVRQKHFASFNLGRVVADLSDAQAQFAEATKRWAHYAAMPCSVMDATSLLKYVKHNGVVSLTEKQEAAILNEFNAPRHGERDFTMWGLYNAITAVASHDARGKTPTFALLHAANDILSFA